LPFVLTALFLLGSCSAQHNTAGRLALLNDENGAQRTQHAVDRFWSSVRPSSTLSDAHYKLGRHYQQQGRYKKALEEFAKALNGDVGMCKAYNGMAMSYDALKQCDLAHKAYDLALQCAPKEPYVYNNYGYSSILCNDLDKGTALLLKAEELSSGSEQIKNNLEFAQLAVTREPGEDSGILPVDFTGLDLAAATPRELAVYLAGAAQKPDEQQKSRTSLVLESEEPEATAQAVVEHAEKLSIVIVPSVGANFQPHLLVDDFESSSKVAVLPAETSAAAVNTGHVVKPVLKPAVRQKAGAAGDKRSAKMEGGEDNVMGSLSAVAGAEAVGRTEAPPQVSDEEADGGQAIPPGKEEAGDRSQVFYGRGDTGVEVSNGNGVTGMAKRSSELLSDYGFRVRRITNASNFHFGQSVIYFREGYLQVARELSHFLPGDQKLEQVDSLGRAAIGVKVLLGSDLVMLDFPDYYSQLSYIQLEQGKLGDWSDLVTLNVDE